MSPRPDLTTPELADLPGWGDLPRSTLQALDQVGRTLRIPAGWSPIHQSEPADEAYLLLEGELVVVQDGTETARVGPGSLAGEMGLVDHRLRNARITTAGPALVLAWPRADFHALRVAHPAFDALVRRSTQDRHDEARGRDASG